MAVARNGDLYIAESNCTIRKIGSDGLLTTIAGTGSCTTNAPSGPALSTNIFKPGSMAVDSQGRIYLGSSGILHQPDGSTQGGTFMIASGTITQVHFNDGYYWIAPHLAIDSTDRVYIIDSSLAPLITFARLMPDGNYEGLGWLVGHPPVGAIGIDAADNVYLTPKASWPIFRFTPGGTETLLWQSDNPTSIAIDASGNVWEAVLSGTQGVFEINASEKHAVRRLVGYSGDGGPVASAFFSGPPSQVAFGPDGSLYVLDFRED